METQTPVANLSGLKLRGYDSGVWCSEADWFDETVRTILAFVKAEGQPDVPRPDVEALVRDEFVRVRGRQPDLRTPEWLKTRRATHKGVYK